MFIVVGTTHLDIYLSGVPHLPAMGQDEFTADNLVFSEAPLRMVLGGNGGTTAYALARLEVQVLLCSAVGRDVFGEMIGNWLTEPGVRLAGLVRTSAVATSTTTIVSDEERRHLAIHHRGASTHFEAVRIPPGAFRENGVLHVSSYPLLNGWRGERAQAALAEARQAGVITALDVGPAVGTAATLAELAPLLPHVDYLLANEHELEVCTGEPDPSAGAALLWKEGARCLVLKRGREGVTVYPGRDGTPVDVPGFEVDAASTIGSGDAFNAGFLYGVQREWPLERAARFANAVSALVVRGGRGGLGAPPLADVERFLQAQAAPAAERKA